MKRLESFSQQVSDLRRDMLNVLRDFFERNQSVVINPDETMGSTFLVRGDKEVTLITKDGVFCTTGDFPYDELDLVDLDYIIDVINTYLSDTYRPKE